MKTNSLGVLSPAAIAAALASGAPVEKSSEWRSATDPSSGRMYWYHREHRRSLWNRPLFDIDLPSNVPLATQESSREPQSVVEANRLQTMSTAKTTTLDTLKLSSVHSEEHNVAELKRILHHLTQTRSTDLPISLDSMSSQLGYHNSRHFLTTFFQFLLTSLTHKMIRTLGFQVMFHLLQQFIDQKDAIFHLFQSHFHSLYDHIDEWAQNDVFCESIWYACVILLCTNQLTYHHIVKSILQDVLVRVINSFEREMVLLEKANGFDSLKLMDMNDDMMVCFTGRMFTLFHVLIENGHELPAMLSAILCLRCIRNEKFLALGLQNGLLPTLQLAASQTSLSDNVRRHARHAFVTLLQYSPTVRERTLDQLLELSGDLSVIPNLRSQPNPLLHGHEFYEDDINDPQRDSRELFFAESFNADRELIEHDVEWIPRSGTSWLLSSTLLWSRCPELRELIADFWSQGGGHLTLNMDASDVVLSTVTQFIHTGTAILPGHLLHRLEVLRVSVELGLHSLQLMVQDHLAQSLTRENASIILDAAQMNGVSEFEKVVSTFISSGRRPANRNLLSAGSITNSALHNAVKESLNDVNHLLAGSPSAVKHSPATHNHSFEQPDRYSEPVSQQSYRQVPTTRGMSSTQHVPITGNTPSNLHSNMSNTRPRTQELKPKSGGIYGLLLQQQGNPQNNSSIAAMEYTEENMMYEFDSAMSFRPSPSVDASLSQSRESSVSQLRDTGRPPSAQRTRPNTTPVTTRPASINTAAPQSVRSSLTLLKTKTARARTPRRMSTADSGSSEFDISDQAAHEETPIQSFKSQSSFENDAIHGLNDFVNQGDASNEYSSVVLIPCPDCGRSFNQEALTKHAKVCKKVFLSQRNPYNSAQHRKIEDPDAIKSVSRRTTTRPQSTRVEPTNTKSDNSSQKWREQSNAFRDAMRAARMYAQGKEPPPSAPTRPDPSLIQCPNCERRFNEKAASRHIPLCKNIQAKPARLLKGGGTNASASAAAAAAKRTSTPSMDRRR